MQDQPFVLFPQPNRRIPTAVAILNLKGFWARVGGPMVKWLPAAALLLLAAYAALHWDQKLESLGLIAGGVALALGFRAALRPGAVLTPLALPKGMTDAGWTGEVASRRIIDAALDEVKGAAARGVVNPFQPFEPLPKLEVPGFKLDPDVFGDLLREVVGKRRLRIGGEILDASDTTYVLRLRGLEGTSPVDCGPFPRTNPERLLNDAALKLLTHAAPYNLAYAHQQREDFKKALDAALTGSGNEALPATVRARCHVLRWHNFRALGRFEDAEGALSDAAKLTCTDLMVAAAIGEHLSEEKDSNEPSRHAWRRLVAVAMSWKGTEDLSHVSIAEARRLGQAVISRREHAAEMTKMASSYLIGAHRGCWRLEQGLLRPSTPPRNLGDMALGINEKLASAGRDLAKAREIDPDNSAEKAIARIERKRARLAEIREKLGRDARVQEGIAASVKMQEMATSLLDQGIDLAETAARGFQKILKTQRDLEPGGISSIQITYGLCRDKIIEYRREGRDASLAYILYWSAIDRLLEASAELETAIAHPRMIRRHGLTLRRRLVGVEMLGRWLLKRPPSDKPNGLNLPTRPPPPEPIAPGVSTSDLMRALRSLRERLWQRNKEMKEERQQRMRNPQSNEAAAEQPSAALSDQRDAPEPV